MSTELDDARGRCSCRFVLTYTHDVVDRLLDFVANLGKATGRGLTADVGRGGYDGLAETEAQLLAELLACNADTHATIFAHEIGCKVARPIVNDGEGLGGKFDEVPCHGRHLAHVEVDLHLIIHEHQHSLAIDALFDFIHTAYGLFVGGITPDAPHCIGGIQDDTAVVEHVARALDLFSILFVHAEFMIYDL